MARLSTLWAEFKAFAFKGNMIDLAIAVVIGTAFSGVVDSLVKDIIMPTISYATTAVKEAGNAAVDAADAASQVVGITTQPATQPATQSATQPAAETKPAEPPATAPTSAEAPAVPTTQEAQASKVADQMLNEQGAGKSKEWRDMVSAFATALEADRKAADAKAAILKAEADRKAAEEKPVDFSWKLGRINIGNFVGAVVNFLIIALAVFLIMVKILGGVMKRAGGTPAPEQPTTKECPECLSIIPIKARRCPNCTSVLSTNATPTV